MFLLCFTFCYRLLELLFFLQYSGSEKCIHISQLLKPIIGKRNAAMLRSYKQKKNVCYILYSLESATLNAKLKIYKLGLLI